MNGRSSHLDVFYEKVFLKVLQFPQKNICAGVSFKQVYCSSAGSFIKKRLQHWHLTPVNFANFLLFFKNISGQMLLEKHWISLKMVPIAFPVNVSKLISKKGLNFSLFFFCCCCSFWVLLTANLWIFQWNLLSKFSLLYHRDLYLHGFMKFNQYTETINCLSLNNSMILRSEDFELSQQR